MSKTNDDRVWVTPTRHTDGTSVFHTHPDCQYISPNPRANPGRSCSQTAPSASGVSNSTARRPTND